MTTNNHGRHQRQHMHTASLTWIVGCQVTKE